jgi:hypothetical protein
VARFFFRAAGRIPSPDFSRRVLALRGQAQQENDIDNIFATATSLFAQGDAPCSAV